ncbi:hypothetical protein E1293_10960 [Actinomadura darangshiensis]|uniref:Uncharacterized protein n=1 Tax=Actinomadura darangshiensis TaxID=705336 RepID=A0A4R5BG80_9ACTN|nr:hypothetical protein [Actinomadura darangshiensis]TDD85618.1 hypothetical protein E1293_10960 [Actinomadura darangshiensis]
MTTEEEPTSGLDFWETIGVNDTSEETSEAEPHPVSQQDKLVAGTKSVPPPETPPGTPPEPQETPPSIDIEQTVAESEPSPSVPASSPEASPETTTENGAAPSSDLPHEPDPSWDNAARIAESIGPRLGRMWLDLLIGEADGDQTLGRRIYHVLDGTHLIGELWQDKDIAEVHIRGTGVIVCGRRGIREVLGFPGGTVARRAIEAVEAAADRMAAIVTRVGDSVVVSRRDDPGPTAIDLFTSGILTEAQLSHIENALTHMEAVSVRGPAARVVVRALASLIPKGSRVFEGPLGVLPAGCVTAASPLDADFVIGVRPGAPVEQMAAAGQVGALIANPETEFSAAVRLVVSGGSASLGRLTILDEDASLRPG